MKAGDKVFISVKVNEHWTGTGTIIEFFRIRGEAYADVQMIDGKAANSVGAFPVEDLMTVEDKPLKIEGGTPHGFGVWIDGKYHPLDIGALGLVITKMTEQMAEVLKENERLKNKIREWSIQ